MPANGFTMADISLILKKKNTRDWIGRWRNRGEKGKRKERMDKDHWLCLAAIVGFLPSSTIMIHREFPEKGRIRRVNQNSHFHGSPTTFRERSSICFPTRNRMNRFPETGLEIDSFDRSSVLRPSTWFLETHRRNNGRYSKNRHTQR